MPEVNESRAPYVAFETKAIEDREASAQAGRYMTKDVDFVLVTPAGSKDRIEGIVQEWFDDKRAQVREGRFPANWLQAYEYAYKEWKAGNEMPVNGTPIKSWPVISPAQRANLISWKVMTVEALADANEEILGRLGMGARAIKQQAIDYLLASKDIGRVSLEVGDLRAKLDTLTESNRLLQEQNALLKASLPEAPESRQNKQEARREEIGANDLLDDAPARKL